MRKIEVPKDIPTEFELGYTAADIQRRREETEHREREEAEKQQRKERERKEARRVETPQAETSQTEEGVAKKKHRTEESESEMDTECVGEAKTYQSKSRCKKGLITNR